jgi:hypothetical protein
VVKEINNYYSSAESYSESEDEFKYRMPGSRSPSE